MTGKQLRNSILQWAIQGKLVPQDPNDEPASVLLERIREEKAHLVKEKKIKRDKNESIIYRGEDNSYYEKMPDGTVRCIDFEIPFEIPDSWVWCRVSNIFILNPKNNNEDDDMAAFIPMEMINACYGSSYTYKEVKWKSIKNGYTHFSDGDIAFAKITPCFQNRKSAVFENLPNGIGAGTTELKVLRPYVNTVNPYYLLFFLETPYFVEEASFKGTANQQRIISGYLEGKLFPLPPKAEQDRIVKQVQQLLPLTDKYESAFEANLRQQDSINTLLRKSILQEAIQGKLVPQLESEGTAEELLAEIAEEKKRLVKDGKLKKSALTASRIFRGDDNRYYEQIGSQILDISSEITFDIPDSWRYCRLGDIAYLRLGKTPPRGEPEYWKPGEYPWVSIADMVDGGTIYHTKESISKEGARLFQNIISPAGSLIMSFKLTIGKISILGTHAFHNEAIVTICPYVISADWLKCFLPMIAQTGTTKDAIKGKTLNSKSLNALLIPLPPLLEQKRILAMIDKISETL